jgi:hypothetical protein
MSVRENLEKQARRAMLRNALLNWRVLLPMAAGPLLAIADTLLNLTPATDFAWLWAIGGISLAVISFVISLRDPGRGADVVADMLREEFRPEALKSRDLQAKLNEALDYYRKMMRLIEERSASSMLTDELVNIADQMDEWIREIYDIAVRIDNSPNEARQRAQNIKRTQTQLRTMELKFAQEEDPDVRAEMQRNLDSLRYKLQTLENIAETNTRALLILDNQLTNMSTIYLQATLMGAKEIDNSRAQRLREEIAQEVQSLDDILLTMEEIYATREQYE